MRVLIATDAWHPQINGVVRTLARSRDELLGLGHAVEMITPDRFRSFPCPTYPEINLAITPGRRVREIIENFEPDAVHIATEGPLGMATRRYCRKRGLPFTTSFHTRFPEYINLRLNVPVDWGYRFMRWFHAPAARTLVATETLKQELKDKGFEHLALWSRGVDTEIFQPRGKDFLDDPRPIFMFVGRVAVEKNIEAFLDLDLPGTRYVVGDGPDLEKLKTRYPSVRFPGAKTGIELAQYFSAADALVFPSLTDTFGLVLLEAMACGVPAAAYPVEGPKDVVIDGKTGCLNEDLHQAALDVLKLNPADCRDYALKFNWTDNTRRLLDLLCPINGVAANADDAAPAAKAAR
jgi:glycosyltransferase involved in cell wall biosynthesis